MRKKNFSIVIIHYLHLNYSKKMYFLRIMKSPFFLLLFFFDKTQKKIVWLLHLFIFFYDRIINHINYHKLFNYYYFLFYIYVYIYFTQK